MTSPQFSINYNGHKTAVTHLGDNTFLVQITFKPYRIKKTVTEEGADEWIEVEIDKETPLSKNIGELITDEYVFSN